MVDTCVFFSFIFLQFYIAPCFGVGHVGYGIAAFGAANTVTTAVLPLVLKLSGRPVVVTIASCMELSVMLTLVLWTRSRNAVLLYALAAMWGSADGIWNIIMSGLCCCHAVWLFALPFSTASRRVFEFAGCVSA